MTEIEIILRKLEREFEELKEEAPRFVEQSLQMSKAVFRCHEKNMEPIPVVKGASTNTNPPVSSCALHSKFGYPIKKSKKTNWMHVFTCFGWLNLQKRFFAPNSSECLPVPKLVNNPCLCDSQTAKGDHILILESIAVFKKCRYMQSTRRQIEKGSIDRAGLCPLGGKTFL
ncbi:hypothetical protein L596_016640 [Steinernema carpocapsae]|uniref:Uncharacterized protein n=1 Tax=Steinernema carpocapsae TaxID=34508 RepID=A0A4V6A3H8_STECR|nr:hypothetical protein L596_016640 [Steinernema carpocapsae]